MGGDRTSTFSPRSPSVCKESPCSDTDRFKCVCHALASPDALLLTALWKQRCFSSRSGVCICQLTEAKPLLLLKQEGSGAVRRRIGTKHCWQFFVLRFSPGSFCLSFKEKSSFLVSLSKDTALLSAGSIQSQSLLCMLLNETSTAESYCAGTSKPLGNSWERPD